MRLRFCAWLWPRSLAARTAFVLLLGLTLVQAAGLTIHAFDRVELQRLAQAREISARAFAIWRSMVLAPPDRRAPLLADIELPAGLVATLDDQPLVPLGAMPPPVPAMRLFRMEQIASGGPRGFRPREVRLAALEQPGDFLASLRLPDGP